MPPGDHDRALGIVLLQGPRGALFLMSEVPLYPEAMVNLRYTSFCQTFGAEAPWRVNFSVIRTGVHLQPNQTKLDSFQGFGRFKPLTSNS